MKRIIAVILVLMMVLTAVGCGGKKREPIQLTLSTEDSEAILAAAGITLPDAETAPGAGSHVKWYSWYDPLENYSEDEIVNTGNWTFKNKYGGTVEWVECIYENYYDDLAAYLTGGTPPDATQATSGVMALYPMNCIKGMIQAVDPYIDLDDPLWEGMKEFSDKFMLGGQHYHIVTDVSFDNVVCYNRRVMAEWGFEDPAELYYNDEWDWDIFYEMCMDFSDGDEDRYALDGYAYAGGIMESTGQQLFGLDESGKFVGNIDSPEIERSQQLVYDLVKNGCTYQNGGWALRGDGFGNGMADGKCLFYIIATWAFTGRVEEITPIWGDVSKGEVMFAPLPRDPQGDGNYYLHSGISGYSIIKSAYNPEGVALLAMCERFKIVDPTVVKIDKKQLKEIYLWTDEMLDMYDECYRIAAAHPVMNLVNNLPDNLSAALGNLQNGTIHGGSEPSSWAQLKETYGEQIEYYIDELNQTIEDFNNQAA